MKPTYESIMKVVHLFADMIPFFPAGTAAHCAVCEEIYSFVGTEEQLAWFSLTYRRTCGKKWEGEPLLRAVNAVFAERFGAGFVPLVAGRAQPAVTSAPLLELLVVDEAGEE